jgi:hypothetical protein
VIVRPSAGTTSPSLRQPLATGIDELLNGAAFGGGFNEFTALSDLFQAQRLLRDIRELRFFSAPPSRTVCSAA